MKYENARPIRRQIEKRLGFPRLPPDEPLVPGLRRKSPASAIGFLANLTADDEPED